MLSKQLVLSGAIMDGPDPVVCPHKFDVQYHIYHIFENFHGFFLSACPVSCSEFFFIFFIYFGFLQVSLRSKRVYTCGKVCLCM